jgi:hypothetical protein
MRLAPGIKYSLFNRAAARYKAGLGADPRVADPRAAADVTAALAAGPASADLHFLAARIYAASSGTDPALKDAAVAQLEAAVRAGKNPAEFRKDYVLLEHLTGHEGFEAACAAPQGRPPANPPQLRLVEPVP